MRSGVSLVQRTRPPGVLWSLAGRPSPYSLAHFLLAESGSSLDLLPPFFPRLELELELPNPSRPSTLLLRLDLLPLSGVASMCPFASFGVDLRMLLGVATVSALAGVENPARGGRAV